MSKKNDNQIENRLWAGLILTVFFIAFLLSYIGFEGHNENDKAEIDYHSFILRDGIVKYPATDEGILKAVEDVKNNPLGGTLELPPFISISYVVGLVHSISAHDGQVIIFKVMEE